MTVAGVDTLTGNAEDALPAGDPVREAWDVLAGVPDPEVPVVSVVELGIARHVDVSPDGDTVTVTITPTYSGCPAMRAIEDDVREALSRRFAHVEVRTVLSPAWTTDWLTDDGRRKLAEFGIAPPERGPVGPSLADGRRLLPLSVVSGADAGGSASGRPKACPHCGSTDVERITEFASTACKAMYRCRSCAEPFDYFKAH